MTGISLDIWGEAERDGIREQLARILNSTAFQQSRRRQRFLEYIVTETLAGRGDRIKGFSVAQAVFDRTEAFDANVDPIVRVEAARVRDRLREYYDGEGRNDPVLIELPKGTYTPAITLRQAVAAPSQMLSPPAMPQSAPAIPSAPATSVAPPGRHWSGRWRIAALVGIVAVVVGLAWRGHGLLNDRGPGTAAPASSVGPAIAVLPFTNLSGDPQQDYFSDGLTEDLLTELSRAKDLRVLARNTTFQFKGKAVDVRKLGRDLQVRYVLEGSVQRAGDALRVTAQLIDANTGAHIWAQRFDRRMAEVFLIQDEIVGQIFARIAGGYGVIESNEAKAVARKRPEQIQAYDLVLRAHDVMWTWNKENYRTAHQLIDQAIALDPGNARARRELAWIAIVGLINHSDDAPLPPAEIAALAGKAIQLDPSDGRAHMVAAEAYFFNKQLDLFRHETELAIAYAPNDAENLATLGYMVATSGDWRRGVELATRANALNADAAAGWYHATLYLNFYLTGDYKRALELIRQDPSQDALYSLVDYLPILGQLGLQEEARVKWQGILREKPDWTAQSFVDWYKVWNIRDEDMAKLMAGIYKAGVLGPAPPAAN